VQITSGKGSSSSGKGSSSGRASGSSRRKLAGHWGLESLQKAHLSVTGTEGKGMLSKREVHEALGRYMKDCADYRLIGGTLSHHSNLHLPYGKDFDVH